MSTLGLPKPLYDERRVVPAEQLFDKALRYMPYHEDALLGWGLLYAATGRGPLALQKIQQIQKTIQISLGPYRAIGTLLRVSGRFLIAEKTNCHSFCRLCLKRSSRT